jgi:hypothetical protein
MITHIKATYICKVFQYQACVYQTQPQYHRSHVLLTEMLQSEQARETLPAECILTVENFQVTMKDKEQYIAYHVRKYVSLSYSYLLLSILDTTHYSIQCDHLHQPTKSYNLASLHKCQCSSFQVIRVKFPQK